MHGAHHCLTDLIACGGAGKLGDNRLGAVGAIMVTISANSNVANQRMMRSPAKPGFSMVQRL